MTAYYDDIAHLYTQARILPYYLAKEYTYLHAIQEIAGKSILDLDCGDGYYTRKLKQKGAARVVGIDLSEKMIDLAKQEETREPLGIEYRVDDVLELGKIGEFDLVVGLFVLNYMQSQEQLSTLCRTISANLKPGGRFVALNNNLEQSPGTYPRMEKYGYRKSISGGLQEGAPITGTFLLDNETTCSFTNYYLSKTTYERAFHDVGFADMRWRKPLLPPKVLHTFGQEYWQDFMDYPPMVVIECLKRSLSGLSNSKMINSLSW